MQLLVGTLISGIVVGTLYGLLGLPVVLLYKCTGVANFAVGSISTFLTFVVFLLMKHLGIGIWPATLLGLTVGALLGVAMYLACIRVNDESADHVNNLMRTLALFALLGGLVRVRWAAGEPFAFPSLFPEKSFAIGAINISYQSLGSLAIAVLLASMFWFFFTKTRMGLLFLATAERPDIAQLLGVNTRTLSAFAWATTALIALVVGVLVAPTSMLSSTMMGPFLLYAFTAAIVGGLTSLPGVFAGGIIVGVVSNLISVYVGYDPAVFADFILLLIILLVRPAGLFGNVSSTRL